MKTLICTINHNERKNERVGIYYDADEKKLYAEDEIIDTPELNTIEEAEDFCDSAWGVDPLGVWDTEWVEREDDEDIVLKIGRIGIKSETFCTAWNDQLYCVDVCEDSEERTAWLYNSAYGVKAFVFGQLVKAMSRDEFLNIVFSNLPDYIEDYAEEYED